MRQDSSLTAAPSGAPTLVPGSAPGHHPRPRPVRVRVEAAPVVAAGLRAMLSIYPASVTIEVGSWSDTADVTVVDLATQHGPPLLAPARTPVVALVRAGDQEARSHVRQVGAVAVRADAPALAFVKAVQAAHALQRRPTTTADPLETTPGRGPVERLSPRESEVLTAICLGMSNVDIAADLYLSINSVKTYIRSAYRKMGVTSRSQAVLWGLHRQYGGDGASAGRLSATSAP